MKKTTFFGILFFVNFILTFIFMVLKNLLFLMTFGLLFIISTRFEALYDNKHAIKYNEKHYKDYKVGKFQKKLGNLYDKISNISYLVIGLSMCLWYFFIILIKRNYISAKFMIGLILPLNMFLPIIVGCIYLLYINKKIQKHKSKYDIKILAQCIDVVESRSYENNKYVEQEVNYIVTYKFYYNNEIYTVSSLSPKAYINIPIVGNSYEIIINKDDPADFLDDNISLEKGLKSIYFFLLLSSTLLAIFIYIFIAN